MPEPQLGSVPFTEAIDYFRRKINLPTETWADLQEDAHARAFVVAGATKADLLQDLRGSIDDALADGTTLADFRKQFDEIVEKHGWSYKGKRGWRTRVMFQTNIRTAAAAGEWQQIQRTKHLNPWLIYRTANDERVRPEHREWHNLVLPVDDPWWDTHFPPNGWLCRCGTVHANDRFLERRGMEPAKRAPKVEFTERVNRSTGEVLPPTPKGIDTGWGYNVGKASQIGPAQAFGQRVMRAPRDLRAEMLRFADQYIRLTQPGFRRWTKTALESGLVHNEVRPVAFLPFDLLERTIDDGAKPVPASAVVTVSDRTLRHMVRPAKAAERGTALPEHEVLRLSTHVSSPVAVLFDKQNQQFVFVSLVDGESRLAVIPVAINYQEASAITNSIRSAGLVSKKTLTDKARYEVLKGEL